MSFFHLDEVFHEAIFEDFLVFVGSGVCEQHGSHAGWVVGVTGDLPDGTVQETEPSVVLVAHYGSSGKHENPLFPCVSSCLWEYRNASMAGSVYSKMDRAIGG